MVKYLSTENDSKQQAVQSSRHHHRSIKTKKAFQMKNAPVLKRHQTVSMFGNVMIKSVLLARLVRESAAGGETLMMIRRAWRETKQAGFGLRVRRKARLSQ